MENQLKEADRLLQSLDEKRTELEKDWTPRIKELNSHIQRIQQDASAVEEHQKTLTSLEEEVCDLGNQHDEASSSICQLIEKMYELGNSLQEVRSISQGTRQQAQEMRQKVLLALEKSKGGGEGESSSS